MSKLYARAGLLMAVLALSVGTYALREDMETDAGAITFTVEEIPRADMLEVNGYEISSEQVYQRLNHLQPVRTWTSPDGTLDISYYREADAELLGIPDVQTFHELAKVNDDITISYTTTRGEYIVADYCADGTVSFAVNPQPETGEQVIEYISAQDTVRVYHFKAR